MSDSVAVKEPESVLSAFNRTVNALRQLCILSIFVIVIA